MMDDSDVFSIAVDRNRSQRVFASVCNGIYRSLSGGDRWIRLPGSKDASNRTYSIVQDPQFENVLFAGTSQGMIRSGDGGTTWEKIAPYATRSIAFDMQRLGRIYIATDDFGVLRSEDNGRTWREINRGFSSRQLTRLAVTNHGSLYTSTVHDPVNGGLYRLDKGQDKWSRVVRSSGVLGEPMLNVVPVSGNRNRLFAMTAYGVLVSRDAGKTWVHRAGPAGDPGITDLFAPPWASHVVLGIAGPSIFMSYDSARTWRVANLLNEAPIRSLVALDPPRIAAITASGMLLSRDAETWSAGTRWPDGVQINGVVPLGGETLLAATSAGLMALTDPRGFMA
jgi:photosystem II stability/assembly factor-like uncharacterized protein